MPSWSDRRFAAWAAALIVAALVIRVAVVLTDGDFKPEFDSADYARHARSIAAGHGFPDTFIAPGGGATAGRSPVFPYFLGAVYKLPGPDLVSARLAEAVLGALTVALIGLICWQLWGRRTALVSMGLAAVFPPLIVVGASLMSESIYVPLELAAVAAVLAHRRSTHTYRWPLIAGALLGLTILARAPLIILALPLAIGVWTARPRMSRAALAQPLLLLGLAVLLAVPWTVRNYAELHEFVPLTTQGGYGLAGTYNRPAMEDRTFPWAWRPANLDPEYARTFVEHPDYNEADVDRDWGHKALQFIGRHPAAPLEAAFWNSARFLVFPQRSYRNVERNGLDLWLLSAGAYGFLIALPLAVLGAFTRAARAAPAWFWLCPVLLWIGTVLFAGFIRYRSTVDPFVVMLAALGLVWIADRLAGWRPRPARTLARG
jgi:4-amino-4-deoxy-L-arabinose transferase-like glycosyltransferase